MHWGDTADQFLKPCGERYLLDLWGANELVLRQAGVSKIEQSRICTAEHLDEWYSYRKEKGATGRFGVVIALKRA
jgi:copper oxidase (laccase) domain-containing protein